MKRHQRTSMAKRSRPCRIATVRPWCAREEARRSRQAGHPHQVEASRGIEQRAAEFRARKAAWWPRQQEADRRCIESQRDQAPF